MSWYADLSNETDVMSGSHIRAVGWLSIDQGFSKGPSPLEFLAKLKLLVSKWSESIEDLEFCWFPGGQDCEFCGTCYCSGNLGVPRGELLYVAPEMVSHYVECHSYLPPLEFIAAVMASPLPGTPEYQEMVARFLPLHRAHLENLFQETLHHAALRAIDAGGGEKAVADAALSVGYPGDSETMDRIRVIIKSISCQPPTSGNS
jgi:hypothetical protein